MSRMWTLIRNGGVPPMMFILITGLIAIAAAFHFALRAKKESLGFIKLMAGATLFGTLAASCADVGATLNFAADQFARKDAPDKKGDVAETDVANSPRVAHIIIEGCAESTSPGILGFSFLAMTSLLTAVGRRRLDERTAAGAGG